MTVGENNYDRINDYASVKISLARPHDIRSWSFGEVKKQWSTIEKDSKDKKSSKKYEVSNIEFTSGIF